MSNCWGVAGKPPADQIADAKALLHPGAITADGCAQLKIQALMSRAAPQRQR